MSRKTKAWLLDAILTVQDKVVVGEITIREATVKAADLLLEYISDKDITEAYESIRKWDI